MSTLKQCPFGCEGEPRPTADVDMRPDMKGHIYDYTILCEACGISMSDEDYETLAEAWNTRTLTQSRDILGDAP